MRVAEARLAVGQRPAVGRHDFAARRLKHALARGGVPFVGPAEARVDVGLALGLPEALVDEGARKLEGGDSPAAVQSIGAQLAADPRWAALDALKERLSDPPG